MKIRTGRMAEELKKEIMEIIQNHLKDPRVDGLVSVTEVQVSNDLSYAKVYVTKYGSAWAQSEALKALNDSKGFIRKELSKRFKTRTVPELSFVADESLQYGAKIEAILQEIKNDAPESFEEESHEQ